LLRRYFHRQINDPLLYDIVLNLEHLSAEAAAETIYTSLKIRFAE
jgi:hypothetical protein